MKKAKFIGWLAFLPVLSLLLSAQDVEPIKETVSVINVEVPVRVYSGGRAVSGLSKDDFQIFEDGKLQLINGFSMLRKKIADTPEATNQKISDPVSPPERYFVLVYRIYEFNQQVQDSLDYLFRELFRPDDQLLVMANDRQLDFFRLGDDDQAQNKISGLLKNESLSQYKSLLNYLQQIEVNVNATELKIMLSSGGENLRAEYIQSFLQSYLEAWKGFKRDYLHQEIGRYYRFAKHLEKVRKKKWVLNFYQLEQFPQIAFSGQLEQKLRQLLADLESNANPYYVAWGRSMDRLMNLIDMEMNVADDFPAEEVSKLFYKVNATFHSFFMRISKDTGGKELQFRQVSTDIENSLRELTEKTGGTLIASNDLTDSLSRVAQQEDVYYMLTYEPSSAKKIGKIKVTVANKKYDVLYDDNIRADYISAYLQKMEAENPSVKITNLSFKDKKLSLAVSDFSWTRVQDEHSGMLLVRIRVKNGANQAIFDETKAMKVTSNTFSLSLNFNFLAAGKYDIIIDVADQVSGKSCTEVIQPLVE